MKRISVTVTYGLTGDGRAVIAAAKRGARALGIEFNAALIELSKMNAQGGRWQQDRFRQSRFL